MQHKGVIKFFAILLALVCVFQLSFTFITRSVENKAVEYAHSEEADIIAKNMSKGDEVKFQYYLDSISKSRKRYFLDSMANEEVYNILVRQYTYKEAKERELNLGLDLKGGMNVTMEVSVVDILRALSGYSKDETFNSAITMAREKQKSSNADYVTLFAESFEEIDPNARLASVFNTVELKDRVKYNSTNAEVISVIREETDAAIDRTFNILRTRIDRFGVAQPNIQRLQTAGRILIELPGIKDPERVRKLLQGSAQLEFWETYQLPEVFGSLAECNAKMRSLVAMDEGLKQESLNSSETTEVEIENTDGSTDNISNTEQTEEQIEVNEETGDTSVVEESLLDKIADSTGREIAEAQSSFEDYAKENPLWAYLNPAVYQNESGQTVPYNSARIGSSFIKDTARVNYMLRATKELRPRNLRLLWTVKPEPGRKDVLDLVAIKVNTRDGKAPLGGDVIVDARQDVNPVNGGVEVSMSMNGEGARIWKRLTGENIGKQIAVVLDNYVYSYPNVNSEISGGRSSISGGGMTIEEAQDLANILKAGKLPAPARIVQEEIVGPSLGAEAISAGLNSFVLAFLLVLVYMIFYYNRAGWVADLALVTNIFFMFGVLASFGAVLTLPGIAGIVLTLGMAVDANVIIYERILEEVRAGKGMRLALTDGYKNAYSAIIDGNVTTLLTGIVLFTFGSGPVQGFATTLIIGIISSLFSAIFISRLVFNWMLETKKTVNFDTKITRGLFSKVNFDFISMRKTGYIISSTIIIIGIASLAIRGLNYGVDFSGGRTYVVRFDQPVVVKDVRQALTAEFGSTPEVKTFGPSTQVKITTDYLIDDNSKEVDSIVEGMLYTSLKPFFTGGIERSQFLSDTDEDNKMTGILTSQKVGPTIAYDIKRNAVLAVVFALLVIFAYIAVRFKKWQYGLAGVIALFHDSLITIGLFSLFYGVLPFNLEVDQAFIAAILTIIGYSINDTVIIFDRIREFTSLYPKKDIKTNINNALNSTLGRTFNTSGTTLIVLLIIFIFGGEIIRGFTFALLVGVLIGTYSSLFNASPIAFDLLTRKSKDNKGK